MPFNQYVVTCEGCDFCKHYWAIDSQHAIADVLWHFGIIQWRESTKCPECGGQLKATTSAPTASAEFSELKRKLERSWEPADEK